MRGGLPPIAITEDGGQGCAHRFYYHTTMGPHLAVLLHLTAVPWTSPASDPTAYIRIALDS